jgi:photosystem II stability/assembly factor-like uncharacterized protein
MLAPRRRQTQDRGLLPALLVHYLTTEAEPFMSFQQAGRGVAVAIVFLAGLTTAVVAADPFPDSMQNELDWRLVGPFRAGWGTMAAGIPDQPDVFYFGAAGGGVWRSDDAGRTWSPISDGIGAASVGAIAVSPSSPKVLYAGTGQPEARYDIAAGNGVYRSDDGGRHWRSLGLAETRHIGALLIDPHDKDVALVAALGHFFGPNDQRGVFRTSDGGKSWVRTLFVDAETGAVDLAADPANPRVVFAATWQARGWPWLSYFRPQIGPGSGLYRSSDGGVTWSRIVGNGWPEEPLGRIGLAATHTAAGTRVYAVVDSEAKGGLYRSEDGGSSWARVNENTELGDAYFCRVTVAPDAPDTVYVMGRSLRRSIDGGKSFTVWKGSPGGDDYHHLWINPAHPERMVTASDQGTVVTVNGGATWSTWYNQPTGQLYRVATDDQFPYRIYAGQQDSGTVAVASRSDYGAIGYRDWHPVGGDERDCDIPDPEDANIVYSSGLGGRLSRWDARNGEVQNITPWAVSSYGQRPTDFRYRYNWITPIAVSRVKPHALFFGAQILFRSIDQGQTWQAISPDLSAKAASPPDCTGDLDKQAARACGYGVINTIAPSPRDAGEIWVGTDDGLIKLTRDGGKSWRDVTPASLPAWAKVSAIDLSALEPGTGYAAVDNHRQDDFGPHVFRTHDYGATWTEGAGWPRGTSFVSVVRADPARAGLLYAGTDLGAFVSLDDGASWRPLGRGLPVASVVDLTVHGDDVIAATQGRAIWVLDGVSRLREASAAVAAEAVHLFRPATAIRLRHNQNRDTPLPPDEPVAPNPPGGAVIEYWLARAAKGPVALTIQDASGRLVRRFASDDAPTALASDRYFSDAWIRPPAPLATSAGAHRFGWDLREPRPRAERYEYSIAATPGVDTPLLPEGALVPPGEYQVVLSVDGAEYRAPLRVQLDPRVVVAPEDLKAAYELHAAVAGTLERAFVGQGQVRGVRKALKGVSETLAAGRKRAALLDAVDRFDAALAPLVEAKGEESANFADAGGVLASLATDIEATDRAPTAAQRELYAVTSARVERAASSWRALESRELVALNARLRGAKLAEIRVPVATEIGAAESRGSRELP